MSDIDERIQPVKCGTTKHLKTFQKCYLLSSAKNPTDKVHYHERRRRRRRRSRRRSEPCNLIIGYRATTNWWIGKANLRQKATTLEQQGNSAAAAEEKVANSATPDERRGSGPGTVQQQSAKETVTWKRRNLKVLCVFMNVPPLLAAATRQAHRQIISQNVVAHKWTKASITCPYNKCVPLQVCSPERGAPKGVNPRVFLNLRRMPHCWHLPLVNKSLSFYLLAFFSFPKKKRNISMGMWEHIKLGFSSPGITYFLFRKKEIFPGEHGNI